MNEDIETNEFDDNLKKLLISNDEDLLDLDFLKRVT